MKFHSVQELWPGHRFSARADNSIRAVAGHRSSPESRLATKIKIHLTKKKTELKLMYIDVLYFDLQPHPIVSTLGSVVMEWKQTLFEI